MYHVHIVDDPLITFLSSHDFPSYFKRVILTFLNYTFACDISYCELYLSISK